MRHNYARMIADDIRAIENKREAIERLNERRAILEYSILRLEARVERHRNKLALEVEGITPSKSGCGCTADWNVEDGLWIVSHRDDCRMRPAGGMHKVQRGRLGELGMLPAHSPEMGQSGA